MLAKGRRDEGGDRWKRKEKETEEDTEERPRQREDVDAVCVRKGRWKDNRITTTKRIALLWMSSSGGTDDRGR